MRVIRPDLFIGSKSQQTAVVRSRAQENGFEIYVRNLAGIKNNIDSVLDTSESFEKAVEAIFAANVILVIFFSSAIQTMWSMLSSLQMMVITILFSCYHPMNSLII